MVTKLVELIIGVGHTWDECKVVKRQYTDIEVKNKIIVHKRAHIKIASLGTHDISTGLHIVKLLNPTEAEIIEHTLHALDALERRRLAIAEKAMSDIKYIRDAKQKVLAEMDASTHE